MDNTIRPIRFHKLVLEAVTEIQKQHPELTLSRLVNDALGFYMSEMGLQPMPTKESDND
jgi:hypothetical protein